MAKHQSVCRRRTLSLADVPDCRKSNRVNSTDSHEIDFSKTFARNMVRRPSFSISDDHQSTSTELPCFPLQNVLEETNLQFKNAREPSELPSLSKSDASPYTTSLFESNSANPLLDIMHTCKMRNTSPSCISSSPLKNVDYLSPSSLLSSALIKLYLSRDTVYSPNNSGREEAKFHCTNCQNLVGLPGCLQIASNLLASMVMPVKHFIGVYSNNNNNKNNNSRNKKLNLGNVYSSNGIFNVSSFVSSCHSDKDVYTDVSYSSSAESVSTWEDASNISKAGYYSDNYLIGAANQVKKCDVYRRCLEMKLRHTPSSAQIPTFTDGNLRSTSAAYIGSASHRQHPHSHHHYHRYHHHHHQAHHCKLALTDIYAGLKSPSSLPGKDGKSSMNSPSSSTSHDTTSRHNNNNVDMKSNSTNTITSQSSILSAYEHSLSSSSALERLCSLWINLKPDMIEEEKFYYMDEKSLERRVNAQASNIISPVSF
ncbi:unnamed protein product [Trichobilharzia szidati]|nr:unnamed protein product [Trichobilharzia szidati]